MKMTQTIVSVVVALLLIVSGCSSKTSVPKPIPLPIESTSNIGASFPNEITLTNTTFQPTVSREKAIEIAIKWFRDAYEQVGGNYSANATVALYTGPYKPQGVEPPITGNNTPVWVVVIPDALLYIPTVQVDTPFPPVYQVNIILDVKTGTIIYGVESFEKFVSTKLNKKSF